MRIKTCASFLIIFLLFISCNRERPAPVSELPVVEFETSDVQEAAQESVIDTSVLRPIVTDPGLVITWPRDTWRDSRYELFSWDIFADTTPVLIFDYADYDMQARMLKRLAFFAEKKGFRGRLAHDSEIAHLHGWNAHDYRAVDLARFFDIARKTNFPLLDEEWELEKILLNEKIIKRESGNIVPGVGAIISIAREAPEVLRYRFMAHETYHALYFIDEDFRRFCGERWELLPEPVKRFFLAYIDSQNYDITDEYLVINEFMGFTMQQPISQAADYFGRNLPSRLENTHRASALPPKDPDTGTWPVLADIFTEEARVISEYVNNRWGFTAGRAWRRN